MELSAHPTAEPFDFITQADSSLSSTDLSLPDADDATVASAMQDLESVRKVTFRSLQNDVLVKVDEYPEAVNELSGMGRDFELRVNKGRKEILVD